MHVKLKLEYDGANYSGWQLQSSQDSIQARVEAALAQLFSEKVRVHGAGRTDAGVHALGQVAAFAPPRPFESTELKRALNSLLPADIVVRDASEVADGFDPRRDARSRVYEYRILNQPVGSAFDYRYSWLVREPLGLDAMNAAARLFVGEHDFAGFRTLGSEERTTVRRVYSSEWRRNGERLIYRVEATAFLRHMVRTMVAVMVEAGRGKLTPNDIVGLLESRDRALAPAPAPASGLFLVEVRY
jgi:tRNA pseudouridine38-40 synthase